MDEKQTTWKDNLLKSSLPLEQLVSEILAHNDLYTAGAYSYIRPNDHNIDTEFSVDVFAHQDFSSVSSQKTCRSNLLVECKYNYPGVKWIFALHPSDNHWRRAMFKIKDKQKYSVPVDKHSWSQNPIPLCTRGIELHNKTFDPNSITRGIHQLLYGLPNLILQETSIMPNLEQRQQADISYFTLLLVTTSDLYVLRPLKEIEVFQNAKELEDVSFKTDYLSVVAERSPLMYQYCIRLVKDSLKNKHSNRVSIDEASLLADQLIPRTIQIFVTNLTHLEKMLSSIKLTALSDFRKECKIIKSEKTSDIEN